MQTFAPLHPIRAKKLSWYIKHLPGLVAYYPLNDDNGSVVSNDAPNTLGSYNGAITGATIRQDGLAGKAISFDGNGDYIDFSGLNLSGGSFSIGFLVKRNGNQDVNDRVFDQQDSGPSGGLTFNFTDTDTIQFVIRNTTTVTAAINTDLTNDLSWYFIVATFETNSAKLFSNGVQAGSTDTSCAISAATATPRLGARAGSTTNYFSGSVQHMFVTNTVITSDTILKLAKIAGLA